MVAIVRVTAVLFMETDAPGVIIAPGIEILMQL